MSLTMVAFGFAVGLLVGITGTGGGSVMTPLRVVVFGINPVTAIGTDIAYSAVEKTVGGVRQLRAGNVDVPLSTRMAFGSVPAAILGVWRCTPQRGARDRASDCHRAGGWCCTQRARRTGLAATGAR
jgi:uncharacterized membrane protein YfcA